MAEFIESKGKDDSDGTEGENHAAERGFIQQEKPAESQGVCTYALSGSSLVHQAVYLCHTCYGNGAEAEQTEEGAGPGRCCCEGCADTCHAEHEVSYLGFGRAYCDCGGGEDPGMCMLLSDSLRLAQDVLAGTPGSSTLGLDDLGRIEGTSDLGLDFSFRACYIPELQNLEVLEALKQQCKALISYSKETFWIPATGASFTGNSLNELESLAWRIFQYHTQDIDFDVESSGAEWWVQVKPADGSDSSVDLHYDKDELIAERFGVGVYPQLSTVTYLTTGMEGEPAHLPTIIFENTAVSPIGAPITKAYLSQPKTAKHTVFDGRFLHGVPLQLSSLENGLSNSNQQGRPSYQMMKGKDGSEPQLRITFLVNIWIGHKPAGVSPLLMPLTQHASLQSKDRLNRAECIQPLQNTLQFSEQDHFKYASQPHRYDVESNTTNVRLTLPFLSKTTTWGKDDVEDESSPDLVVNTFLPAQCFEHSDSAVCNLCDDCAAFLQYCDPETNDTSSCSTNNDVSET